MTEILKFEKGNDFIRSDTSHVCTIHVRVYLMMAESENDGLSRKNKMGINHLHDDKIICQCQHVLAEDDEVFWYWGYVIPSSPSVNGVWTYMVNRHMNRCVK